MNTTRIYKTRNQAPITGLFHAPISCDWNKVSDGGKIGPLPFLLLILLCARIESSNHWQASSFSSCSRLFALRSKYIRTAIFCGPSKIKLVKKKKDLQGNMSRTMAKQHMNANSQNVKKGSLQEHTLKLIRTA